MPLDGPRKAYLEYIEVCCGQTRNFGLHKSLPRRDNEAEGFRLLLRCVTSPRKEEIPLNTSTFAQTLAAKHKQKSNRACL